MFPSEEVMEKLNLSLLCQFLAIFFQLNTSPLVVNALSNFVVVAQAAGVGGAKEGAHIKKEEQGV